MRNTKGFTLIELILYMGIVSMILGSIIPFAWNISSGGAKSSVEQEVSSNARYVSERIKYEIRNASGINSVSSTSISLSETSASVNPTVIDLSGGKIRVTQGVGSAINLNSNDTTISSLAFTNYTSLDNKTKHIGFTFTISYAGGSARQEYSSTTTIESSAELRSN